MTINYLKSVENGVVYTNPTHWTDKAEIIFFYLHNLFFLGFLLVLPTYGLIKDFLAHDIGGFEIVFSGIAITLGLYLTFCLFKWRQLIKIDGVNIEANKDCIISIINGYYPGLNYDWDGNILIGSRPYSNFNFKGGLNVVVIFRENDIYLNILSIYRPGPNPWMAFTNVERAREIRDMFKERTRYGQTTHNA